MTLKIRSLLSLTALICLVTGSFLGTGCNNAAEQTPEEKKSAQQGQAEAFRSQQGGGAKPATQ